MQKLLIFIIGLSIFNCAPNSKIEVVKICNKNDLDLLDMNSSIGMLSVILDSSYTANDLASKISGMKIKYIEIGGNKVIISKELKLKNLSSISITGSEEVDLFGLVVSDSLSHLFLGGSEFKNMGFMENLNVGQMIFFAMADSIPCSLSTIGCISRMTILGDSICNVDELYKLPTSISILNLSGTCLKNKLSELDLMLFRKERGINTIEMGE